MALIPLCNYGLGFSKEVRGTGVKFFGHDGHNYGYICRLIGSIRRIRAGDHDKFRKWLEGN
jgi:hypothetical protein